MKIELNNFGPNYLGLAFTYNNLSLVYLKKNKTSKAKEYINQSISLFKNIYGD